MLTESKHIFRFDSALDLEVCDALSRLAIDLKGTTEIKNPKNMPWHDGDTLEWFTLPDTGLVAKIKEYRFKVCQLVEQSFGRVVFPEYTAVVLWKKSRSHPRHKDNGYPSDGDTLKNRVYTSITYLNEGYIGGETFIKTEHGTDYISVPKTGAIVIFPSDESAEHGVYEVKEGLRVTLPIWFCTDRNASEGKKIKNDPTY